MIFNCSAAAAQHLYGKYKKGSDEGFFEPALSVQETIAERQKRFAPEDVIQWVVHAVKIGRATCLIAMEFTTRWVHVIHQVRKGDVNGFVDHYKRYFTLHRELRLYQQTDRSAMTHINQVSAIYQDVYHDIGTFPDDEETALEFDLRLNRDWRCRKGESFELQVDEKMLIHWMVNYMSVDARDIEQAVARIKSAKNGIRVSSNESPP